MGTAGLARWQGKGGALRGVKDGAGGDSDVIFESKLEFDFFWENNTILHTYSYCAYECYWAFS